MTQLVQTESGTTLYFESAETLIAYSGLICAMIAGAFSRAGPPTPAAVTAALEVSLVRC